MLRRTKRLLKALPLIPTVVALLVLAGVGAWAYSRYHKGLPTRVVTVGTPVKPPADQTNNIAPKSPQANSASSTSSRGSGSITDTQGATTAPTSTSQWTTSASGLITVKQPIADAKLTDGSSIVGSAKLDEVHYRLKDNKVGVIAQGTLTVSNGNFSGVLHFQPQGTGGQLDVFSTDSLGVEYNEVQINVSF